MFKSKRKGFGALRCLALVALLAAASQAVESGLIDISLKDDYELNNSIDGDFRVLDRFHLVAIVMSKSNNVEEDLFYCDLPRFLLFRILPVGMTPATSDPKAGRYYFLQKGKRVENSEPLSLETFDARLETQGIERATATWILAQPAERVPYQWAIDTVRRIAFVLGILLPIPFGLVVSRHRRLRKQLQLLQTRQREATL